MELEISRARGWRLYLKDGRRIVDLWQQEGEALLGHNPPGLLRTLKNTAERGLYAPPPPGFIAGAERRLLRALYDLFHKVSGDYADNFSYRLFPETAFSVGMLSLAGFEEEDVDYYLPFYPFPEKALFHALLPFPFPGAPIVLVLDGNKDAELDGIVGPSSAVSPLAMECAARCIYDLIAAMPARGEVRFSALEKYFAQNADDENAVWKPMGIYVFYEGPQDKYAEICHYFFANGFLLPPPDEDGVVRVSLILPGEMSPGEEAKLAKLFEITGENYRS